MTPQASGDLVVHRLREAITRHDLDALVACFDDDYESEQPAHPARQFRGREQVRRNWGVFFREVPDMLAELVAATRDGDTEWAEFSWTGAHRNGDRFVMRGVTLFEVREGRIVRGRLYMEPVEEGGDDINRAMTRLSEGQQEPRAGQ